LTSENRLNESSRLKDRVAVIDNYDSFTYNLVQLLESVGARCTVYLNDATSPEAIAASGADGVVLGPGPAGPLEAGITLAVIEACAGKVPLLGLCLGHQAIAHYFGARVQGAERLMHGKVSPIVHAGEGLFRGIPSPFRAARYHSLVVDERSLPRCLAATARTPEGELMGIRHRSETIEGIQFHPESILTAHGRTLAQNWVEAP
jgi:anthranilate synthase/aminodeoxychorismate synthase-like glutamine amidotransferase